MKYFLILLFLVCSLCYSQENYPDRTHITYYRLIEEDADGPCNIKSYMEEGTVGGNVRGIDSFDAILAAKLLAIMRESKKWKYEAFWCDNRCIGCETIPNMYIVEVNQKYDTIYTTADNTRIFDPKLQRVYIDKHKKLLSVLPQEFITFYKNSFYNELYRPVLDSTAVEKLVFRNKSLYGYNGKDFEKEIRGFDLIAIDSKFVFDDDTGVIKEFTESKTNTLN